MNTRFLQQLDQIAEAFSDQSQKRQLWLLYGFSLLYLTSRNLMFLNKFTSIAALDSASEFSVGLSQYPKKLANTQFV